MAPGSAKETVRDPSLTTTSFPSAASATSPGPSPGESRIRPIGRAGRDVEDLDAVLAGERHVRAACRRRPPRSPRGVPPTGMTPVTSLDAAIHRDDAAEAAPVQYSAASRRRRRGDRRDQVRRERVVRPRPPPARRRSQTTTARPERELEPELDAERLRDRRAAARGRRRSRASRTRPSARAPTYSPGGARPVASVPLVRAGPRARDPSLLDLERHLGAVAAPERDALDRERDALRVPRERERRTRAPRPRPRAAGAPGAPP